MKRALANFFVLITMSLTGFCAEPQATTNVASSGTRPGEERSDNGIQVPLLWCPSGKFTMGSPASEEERDTDEEQVAVEISQGFWLGKFEVTQGNWERVMGAVPRPPVECVRYGDLYPIVNVTYVQALEFCVKLTESEAVAGRLKGQESYRLPTEAEWEYACRAGTTTSYSFGNDAAQLAEYAWYQKNTSAAGEEFAHQVGLKRANPWGFHDLHGNMFEWCLDAYTPSLPGGRDPLHQDGSTVVVRGGCWDYNPRDARSADRFGNLGPDWKSVNVGFRIVLSSSGH
ncbi:MAG: formylglycine-generating enzyme family protein [Planctomycetota bacterium]|nr:formylglycine-generating enzyme family protein [Planctomycetota bacterium]